MGVKGLTALLQRLAPDAVRTQHISHYKGKSLAIDVSCFLNRFNPHPARVQRNLYRLCTYFHLHDIQPIFVFDGPDRIVEKEQEGIKREAMKERVKKSFQLEKIRKTRLKGLKGSAQILRDFSAEEFVSMLEDMRKQDGGDGRASVTQAVSVLFDSDDEGTFTGRKDKELAPTVVLPTEPSVTPPDLETMTPKPLTSTPPKRSASITTAPTESSSDNNKGFSPQQELHLAKIYDLMEEDLIWIDEESSWTTPTLPDEYYRQLEQDHAQLLTIYGGDPITNNRSITGADEKQLVGILGDANEGDFEGFDVFERELDTLDRMELDVDTLDGMDVIYDLSDQATAPAGDDDGAWQSPPLVLKTGTSIQNLFSPTDHPPTTLPEAPSPEDESAVMKKRVQAALEEYIRSSEKSYENAEVEELGTTSTRKQRDLDALEQKLVQEIKEYTGIEAQLDPVAEEITTSDSDATLLPQIISPAVLEPAKKGEVPLQQEATPTRTIKVEELILETAPAVETEPVWSVDSDPSDTSDALKEEDAILMEDTENTTETPPTSAEGQDQDVKSMIHSVLSAHRQIFTTLERRTLRVTRSLVLSCQRLLVAMGEPVVEAKNAEAEAVCAQLTTLGLTDASVSEDTDTAVFGNGLLLRQVGASGDRGIIEIDPVVAREQLGLSRDAFRDLCILCGTDFSGTMEGIGPKRAAKLIQYYGSIESIMANSGYKPRPDFFYDRARRVFDRTPAVPLDPAVYKPKSEVQPLLLELLLKYDINPEEIKQDLLNGPKTEEGAPAFGQDAGSQASRAFDGSNGMGIDPFNATVISIPSFASKPGSSPLSQ
ncbi:Elongation of fatty acids protein 2 [Mortierella hygrophila]|uniref:Elongation of fatty acids protein 2 n=1 Tax=Mortierella hygrophila TaxID=979708 RepID=A0A9P6EYL0_9FUNG|nr:Elongation of fatty acids protein 2 [Mortierella hygrophila]